MSEAWPSELLTYLRGVVTLKRVAHLSKAGNEERGKIKILILFGGKHFRADDNGAVVGEARGEPNQPDDGGRASPVFGKQLPWRCVLFDVAGLD